MFLVFNQILAILLSIPGDIVSQSELEVNNQNETGEFYNKPPWKLCANKWCNKTGMITERLCNVLGRCYCRDYNMIECPLWNLELFRISYDDVTKYISVFGENNRDGSYNIIFPYFMEVMNTTDVFSLTVTSFCESARINEMRTYLNKNHCKKDENVFKNNDTYRILPKYRPFLNLKKLILSKNCLQDISLNISDIFPNLILVDLSGNSLTDISPSFYPNRIEEFNIGYNKLQSLKLTNLPNLLSLNVGWNCLSNLSSHTLKDIRNLRKLYLNNNNLKELPRGIFAEKFHLVELHLQNNELRILDIDVFKDLYKIKVINLSGNNIEIISQEIFQSLTTLENLSLEGNKLKSLEPKTFVNNGRLRELKLGKNHLQEIPLIEIKTEPIIGNPISVYLNENNISVLHVPLTKKIRKAFILDISDNCIKSFEDISSDNEFSLGKSYMILKCSNCCLTFVSNVMITNVIGTLNISKNKITNLHMSDLLRMNSLYEVDLSFNRIRSFNLSWEYPMITNSSEYLQGEPTKYMLNHNPFLCDCQIFSFLRFLKKDFPPVPKKRIVSNNEFIVDELKCIDPPDLRGKVVQQLKYFELVCNISSANGCPQKCKCQLHTSNTSNMIMIDCSNKGLLKFPSLDRLNSGKSLLSLHFQNNSITEIPRKSSAFWNSISELYLSSNRLKSLKNLQLGQNLKKLFLVNNLLTSLERPLLDVLKINVTIKIALFGNPWKCDCDMLNLKSSISSSKYIVDFDKIKCIRSKNSYVLVTIAKDSELCPSLSLNNGENLHITLYLVIGLVLISTSTVIFIYRYKAEIQLWLFTHGFKFVTEENIDANKKYDAFISYSANDVEWVANVLVDGLENGNPKYKLCIHERDWLAGEWIPEQILRSVQESRRTIIVLTENFIRSPWSRLEFQMAFREMIKDSVNRILVVVPVEVPDSKLLDDDLKAFITTNTYIRYNQENFWKRLRCAMPKVRQSSYSYAIADNHLRCCPVSWNNQN